MAKKIATKSPKKAEARPRFIQQEFRVTLVTYMNAHNDEGDLAREDDMEDILRKSYCENADGGSNGCTVMVEEIRLDKSVPKK